MVSAANGRETLEFVSHFKDPISLMVSDVDMPEIGGAGLVRALLKRSSDLRVNFVSGSSASDLAYEDDFKDCSVFIAKPCDVEKIFSAMRKILIEHCAFRTALTHARR